MKKKVILYFSFCIIFFIVFWTFDIDIYFQKIFFSNTWIYANNSLVIFLYKYSPFPALVLSLIYLILFILSFIKNKFIKYRKDSVIFLLTLIIGSGIITNVILKNYTGRPRPREILEFGGNWKYKKVFDVGIPGKGHSFPCGHSSTGFLFFSLYFIFKRKNKNKTAIVFLIFSFLWGFLIGIGRMAQGAHFLSDVIFSGFIMFLTADIVNSFVDEIDRILIRIDNKISNLKSKKVIIYSISIILIISLVFFFLLSIPFYKENKFSFNTQNKNFYLRIIFEKGDIYLNTHKSKDIYVDSVARGFGFINRNYKVSGEYKNYKNFFITTIKGEKTGIFTELTTYTNVFIPFNNTKKIFINNYEGDINFNIDNNILNIILFTKKGNINIKIKDNSIIKNIYAKTLNGDIEFSISKNIKIQKNSDFYFVADNGKVAIKNKSYFFKAIEKESKNLIGSKELFYKDKKNNIFLSIIAKRLLIK